MKGLFELVQSVLEEMKVIKKEIHQSNLTRLEAVKESWIDSQDVMQLLHISPRTLHRMRECGTLPFSKVSGKVFYKLTDVEALLERNYICKKCKCGGHK